LSDRFEEFTLDRCEASEAPLAAPPVIGPFDPAHHGQAELLPGLPPLSIEDVLLEEGEGDSTAALSPHAPTRPIEPMRPLCFKVRTYALDRN